MATPDYLMSPVSSMDLSGDKAAISTLLTTPAPVYTPELTSGMLDLIQRRGEAAKNQNVADTQADIMARGGTGSSTEYGAVGAARTAGDQNIADQSLAFLLGAADASAKNRQFNASTALGIYGADTGLFDSASGRQLTSAEAEIQRRFEAEQAQKYIDAINSINKKKNKRGNIASGITGLAGAGIGAYLGGPVGAGVGANIGSQLGFLFA